MERREYLTPNGDAGSINFYSRPHYILYQGEPWTASTGATVAGVDDDHVTCWTFAGGWQKETYDIGNFSTPAGATITSIQIFHRVRARNVAAPYPQHKIGLVSGSTTMYFSTNGAINESWATFTTGYLGYDPNTGNPWTEAGINALKIELHMANNHYMNTIYCSGIWIGVQYDDGEPSSSSSMSSSSASTSSSSSSSTSSTSSA